jgi:DNA invertase Pin-like site-specific DNA recombinase
MRRAWGQRKDCYFLYGRDRLKLGGRKRGVAFGRPPKMRPDQQELVRELISQGRSISEIARTFNVHPATIYRCREASEGL